MSSRASIRSFANLAVLLATLLVIAGLLAHLAEAQAPTVTDIRSQIDSHNEQIAALEREIATYQKELNVISGQKQTLEGSIKSIDVSRQKILAQISVTQAKINATNLKLDELAFKITDKSEAIALDQKAIAQSIRKLHQEGERGLIERVFASGTFADGWTTADHLTEVSRALRENAEGLASDRIVLTGQHTAVEATRAELGQLRRQLAAQQGELDANKREKQRLLGQTKQTESSYQSIIAQKRSQQKAFESALSALEDSLKVDVNPAVIPSVGTGVLAWPYTAAFAATCQSKAGALGNRYCITQYFGTTPFSTANPQVYNGSGHNAIDIGMPTGTAVLASLSGSVTGTGNTDAIPGCYSFGKWVLVKHANGLSTLYSHLSSISVSPGQSVSTGSVLGYSGMTGYATGPHLHFGVYASQGTQILTLGQYRGATTPCANARMPVAPKDAYLNPMSYL
ncbi:MAG TPA: peptidoglycan DD-metalloendopeptidase family protein [Candidatus Paceibacterota bacterium]|jgi:murein DD-endopeptidase MepM/ murein hydrolase activator NlpD